MKTATITFKDGGSHTCRFPSKQESPWIGRCDPPMVRGPHPDYPEYRIYQPVPGVTHRWIVTQAYFGTVYDEDEWRGYFERGLI